MLVATKRRLSGVKAMSCAKPGEKGIRCCSCQLSVETTSMLLEVSFGLSETASMAPSGENATARQPMPSSSSPNNRSPVAASQTLQVPFATSPFA
jgi:hypothetical protein